MSHIVMPAKAGIHAFLKARKNFFFEKKKQKTFAPLRAVLAPSRHAPPVMPAQAGIHAFLPFFEGAK